MSKKTKYDYTNFVKLVGTVLTFEIKEFDSGTRLANATIKNEENKNLSKITIFDRKVFKFNNTEVHGIDGLKAIFLDSDGKSNGTRIVAFGRRSEQKTVNKQGSQVTYKNTVVYAISGAKFDTKDTEVLTMTGFIVSCKYKEQDGEPFAKLNIGVVNFNKDKDISGVEFNTVVARGDIAEKLEEDEVGRGSFVRLYCRLKNVLPPADDWGRRKGSAIIEDAIVDFDSHIESDDVDEDVAKTYKLAKALKRGEVISTKSFEFEVLEDDIGF